MINLGDVIAGTTIYIPFNTFDSNGASITLTGLAVTDIEIYKNGSVTQRASDAGYTLLDTDGIDFDGITGIHGFSIDLNDNSDAGFYAAGNDYWVVVSAVTVDTRTVNFVAAVFSIANRAPGKADSITATTIAAGAIDAATFAAGAIDAAAIAADAIGSSELAASAVTEIQTGLATQTSVDTIDDFLDTEIAAIKTNTDLLTAANAEPTGVPAADATPLIKLAWLFMALRNRLDITSTKKTFYDDGGAAEWEKDLTDDGTTYSESEGNAI